MAAIRDEPVETGKDPQPVKEKHDTIQVVEFLLGNEQFAIDLLDVKEVVDYTTITKLPNYPEYVRGIIDLLGEITTIIDLKHRLKINDPGASAIKSSRIVVLDTKITKSKMGILVDDVTSVSTFEGNQVDYVSASANKEDTSITGIIKRKVMVKDKEKNELIIWIDIRQLLGNIKSSA
jgi:purine-binding chemotaxis protein CheW